MNEKSLVAIDLDGTLLTSDGTLAPLGTDMLNRAAEKGIRVVLSTTRNPDYVLPICRMLGISDPIICTNGAQVWGSPDGPVWANHTIPLEAALSIARLADAYNWELSTTIGSMTYLRRRPGQMLGPFAPNKTVVATNSNAITAEPVRILVWQPEAIEGIRSLCRKFTDECYSETYLNPDESVHSLGVFPLQADKGKGLALVLERLEIDREKVVAIGDNPNDLPMFRVARVSVAMGNAPTEVKRKATFVAPSNDDEGVAWAMNAVFGA
jgi:Cof subfamily protein (haloacid dehalogenase superfamily)